MFITLRAGKDKVLTDGENYGTTFDLAEGRNVEDFYEITQEEYEKKMKELEEQMESDIK